jgi:glycosyltransferase involved in cell wall biosynthesis
MESVTSVSLNCLAANIKQPIGVERFVNNVLSGLRLGEINLHCYTRRNVNKLEQLFELDFFQNNSQIIHRTLPVGSTLTRILVEMLVLPFFTSNDDVVLSINNFGPLWGKRDQTRVLVIHDVWFMSPSYDGGVVDKWLFKTLLGIQIKFSTKIVTVSEFSKREVCRFFNIDASKIYVITNCIGRSFECFSNTEYGNTNFLLLIGSDRKNKNIQRSIAGFCQFKRTNPESTVRLVVVGKYSETFFDHIRKSFTESTTDIELAGYVSEDELKDLYQQCTGVLFPSLYEGFGLPAVEGIMFGKPVLVSKNTACSEILSELGVSIDAADTNSIALGIEQLLRKNIDRSSNAYKSFRDRYLSCNEQSKAFTSVLCGSD